MKNTLAYYLLLAYTIAMLKPAIPIVADTMAHFFWEAEHLATVHEHEGKNHVHLEISETQKDAKDNTNQIQKNAEPVSIHLVFTTLFDFNFPGIRDKRKSFQAEDVLNRDKNIFYPPPKC